MSGKAVGHISRSQKSVGRLYKPSAVVASSPPHRPGRPRSQSGMIRNRSSSVGRIYNPHQAAKAAPATYQRLIDYEEAEQKLSKYLECTIRTSGRQKYNYLGQNVPLYDKYKVDVRAVKQRRNSYHSLAPSTDTTPVTNLPLKGKDNIVNSRVLKEARRQNKVELPLKEHKSDNKMRHQDKKYESEQRILGKQFNFGKENFMFYGTEPTLTKPRMTVVNHEEQKNELESRLKKMIHSYESRNKELSMEMHKLEDVLVSKKTEEKLQSQKTVTKQSIVESSKQLEPAKKPYLYEANKITTYSEPMKPLSHQQPPKELTQPQTLKTVPQNQQSKTEVVKHIQVESASMKQIFDKLCVFNLKSICLLGDGDSSLEQLWLNMRLQIVSEQRLRVLKCFISPQNIQEVLSYINTNRIKKVSQAQLTTHTEQYDPFLVEQLKKQLGQSHLDQTTINRWVASQFGSLLEHTDKLWMKHFSQEKLNCQMRTMALERELDGMRRSEGEKELTLRDFTRHMSTLFKANLRNRNLYQLHTKLQTITYIGRLVDLLTSKTSKAETKKGKAGK